MIWSLARCPDNEKQDPVVYGAEIYVVFLTKGPRTVGVPTLGGGRADEKYRLVSGNCLIRE